jgi:hypothetical protein
LAITLRTGARSGLTVTAVVADAEPATTPFRRTRHRAQLPYALGVSDQDLSRAGLQRRRASRTGRPLHAVPAGAQAIGRARERQTAAVWRRTPQMEPPWRARFCANA